MSYEIEIVRIRIGGVWWEFKGMESIGWMVLWSEKHQRPYINQCTGNVVWGEHVTQVTFG
jgi:hypothetical protein